MISSCCPLNDRLLTNYLIENSNSTSNYFHNFSNKSQWIDGLDIWSLTEINRKNFLHQNNFDFHSDLGLYLPKYNKDNSQDKFDENNLIHLKNKSKNSFPERIPKLIKNDLNEDSISTVHNNENENQYSTSFQQLKSNEINTNKVRLSLRHVQSQNNSQCEYQKTQIQQKSSHIINQENIKTLLKEQLRSIFNRETININPKRTLIKIPTIDIKHQKYLRKSIPIIDSTLFIERYDKLQQLLINQTTSQTINNNKLTNIRRSPIHFQGISNIGLTITPLDFASSKNSENSSIETKSVQSNQQISARSSIEKKQEEKEDISLKSSSNNTLQRSSTNVISSNKHSIDEQKQIIRKFSRHYYSASKNSIQRSKTYQILPSLVSGKRIHTPVTNQRL